MGKLMYVPLLSYGHINIGLMLSNHLLQLYKEGHEIYFLLDKVWEAKLKPQYPQFKYRIYKSPLEEYSNTEMLNDPDNIELPKGGLEPPFELSKEAEQKVKEKIKEDPTLMLLYDIGSSGYLPVKEQSQKTWSTFMQGIAMYQKMEPDIDRIIDEVQPDFILTDNIIPTPYITRRNIPWAVIVSANPLVFGLDELPPCSSGLRMDQKEEWQKFRDEFAPYIKPTHDKINAWLAENNCRLLRPNYLMYESPYFNIYCFPKELDYGVPLPGRWFQLESAIAPSQIIKPIDLPADFAKLPGKLIYFSLGSSFSAYLPLVQRLVNILGELPHKFIVSKGIMGDALVMPANCWGEDFIDQKSVLSMVDLFISHGGNNSTIESFHFGVPMIIMPLFGDQHDNATRLEELGLGHRLSATECTKQELETAIESLLSNNELNAKLKKEAARIQSDNGTERVMEEILSYLNKPQNEL